jgi:hypothetical protein
MTRRTRSQGGAGCGKGGATLGELSKRYNVHVNQITILKDRLIASTASAFGGEAKAAEPPINLKTLHAKLGELTRWRTIL